MVPESTRRAGPFEGNSVATSFAFNFKTLAKADIRVVRLALGVETDLVLDSDYSVTLNADQATSPGGSVTYPITGDALAADEFLTILSDLAIEQTTDLPNLGAFYPSVIEDALDRAVMLLGQFNEVLSRAIVLRPSEQDITIDLPQPLANAAIGWNSAGTALGNIVSPGSLSVTSLGASLVGAANVAEAHEVLSYDTVDVVDYGADVTGVSDSTAAFVAAIAAAKLTGRSVVVVPRGKFRITTGAIALDSVVLIGSGVHESGTPYDDQGSVILLDSTSNAPFLLGRRVGVKGISFFYPNQTGGTVSPTVYPPLFTATYATQFAFSGNTVVNCYQFLKLNTGGVGIGDLHITDNRIYAIDKCFWFLNGAPEAMWISQNIFSWGVYEDVTNVGPNYYLRNYTAASGEFMRVDTSGGSYQYVDGLFLVHNLIFGFRYGIRVVSGNINVSQIAGNKFDAVSTWLSVEGTSGLLNSLVAGNFIYSYQVNDATTAHNGMSLTSSGALSDVTIFGNDFVFCRGSHIFWNNLFSDDVTIVGNRFTSWGQSENAAVASYYALQFTDGGVRALISGNRFAPGGGVVAHLKYGIISGGAVDIFVSGNLFTSCYIGVWLVSTLSGKCVVQGNFSSNTVGSQSFRDDTTTAGVVQCSWNSWDKNPANNGFPAFAATVAAGQTISTGAKTKINFGTQIFDQDDNYDPSTSTFTAPVAGLYEFYVSLTNDAGVTIADVWKVAIEAAGGAAQSKATASYVIANAIAACAATVTVLFQLSAGDTVTCQITRVAGAGNYVVINDTAVCHFGGKRVQ